MDINEFEKTIEEREPISLEEFIKQRKETGCGYPEENKEELELLYQCYLAYIEEQETHREERYNMFLYYHLGE